MEIEYKICSKCLESKLLSDFTKINKTTTAGLPRYQFMCRKCSNQQNSVWYAEKQKGIVSEISKNRVFQSELYKSGTKQCKTCSQIKPFKDFLQQGKMKNGNLCYIAHCKHCSCIINKERKLTKDPNYISRKDRIPSLTHKKCPSCKELKELSDFYISKNSKTQKMQHYSFCKPCTLIQGDQYKKANSKKISERLVFRYKTELQFKLTNLIKSRIFNSLFQAKIVKNNRSLELVGCTIEQLREYIESKFTEGMTWNNSGKRGWHLDHIRPCASFDLSDIEQQKQCFHYTNLQPLWAADNIKKSSSYKGKKHYHSNYVDNNN